MSTFRFTALALLLLCAGAMAPASLQAGDHAAFRERLALARETLAGFHTTIATSVPAQPDTAPDARSTPVRVQSWLTQVQEGRNPPQIELSVRATQDQGISVQWRVRDAEHCHPTGDHPIWLEASTCRSAMEGEWIHYPVEGERWDSAVGIACSNRSGSREVTVHVLSTTP